MSLYLALGVGKGRHRKLWKRETLLLLSEDIDQEHSQASSELGTPGLSLQGALQSVTVAIAWLNQNSWPRMNHHHQQAAPSAAQ